MKCSVNLQNSARKVQSATLWSGATHSMHRERVLQRAMDVGSLPAKFLGCVQFSLGQEFNLVIHIPHMLAHKGVVCLRQDRLAAVLGLLV